MNNSKHIEDGGPAYPMPSGPEPRVNSSTGMSLRDYFAAKAMQGILANEDIRSDGRGTGIGTPGQNARNAYAQADAMLKEREA